MSLGSFALELLDTESGHVVQTWELGDSDVFQLGRSQDCDVVLASPFVSRTHVYVRRRDDGWELTAVSRNGVYVDGARVEHLSLEEGLIFRLAERGPTIRFRSTSTLDAQGAGETISFDAARTPLLVLDEQQLHQEVSQIAEGDYFQELQRKLSQLRSRPAVGTQRSSEQSK
jgi:pSer/pThr/pTyr-binding forkhead associated (FHA) protein